MSALHVFLKTKICLLVKMLLLLYDTYGFQSTALSCKHEAQNLLIPVSLYYYYIIFSIVSMFYRRRFWQLCTKGYLKKSYS